MEVSLATKLGQAIDQLAKTDFALVLLDLTLPDSSGTDTVRQIVTRAPTLPIVLLTGNEDETVGTDAVRMGAQDYLPKSELSAALLKRVITHAINRQGLMNNMSELHAIWSSITRSLSALDAGQPSLQKRNSGAFDELVGIYSRVLNRSLDGVRGSMRSTAMQELARRLADVQATVADILDIQLSALGRRVGSGARTRAESQTRTATEHGQMLIIELMGHLMGNYRAEALKARSLRAPRAV